MNDGRCRCNIIATLPFLLLFGFFLFGCLLFIVIVFHGSFPFIVCLLYLQPDEFVDRWIEIGASGCVGDFGDAVGARGTRVEVGWWW